MAFNFWNDWGGKAGQILRQRLSAGASAGEL